MSCLNLVWASKRILLVLTLAATLSPCAQAGSVSGAFMLDGKPFKPVEVAAFRVRQPSDVRKFLAYVVLTTTPVDTNKIKASPDPLHSLSQDPAALGDKLGLWIEPDGSIEVDADVDGDAYTGEAYPMNSPGEPGELIGKCKVNTTTHIACTVRTGQPVKTRDGRTCTFDLAFDSEVLARSGKPMARDGEEPGKAFLALYRAAAGDDLDRILALLLPKKVAKDYKADNALALSFDFDTPPGSYLKRIKEDLELRLPKQPKITGGEKLADDYALLEVECENAGEHNLYLVEMRRIEGTWRYVTATGIGMLR